jgi:hypothetical protein
MSTTTPLFVPPDADDGSAATPTKDNADAPLDLDFEALPDGDVDPVWHIDDADLPKQQAVNRAVAAGVAYGLDDAQALAYAFAVTDPTALRAGYANPMKMAALGGYFEVVDVEVFVHAVVPLPTNNRVLEYLIFPAGGASGLPPLPSPTSGRGEATELVISARSPAHVIEAAERAARKVMEHNGKMLSSISAQGIAMPLTLVGLRVDHADGTPPVNLVACADGSSRVTNAQRSILGLETSKTHYEFSRDQRELRREIGRILAGDPGDNAEKAAERRRALTAPARLILKFVPSSVRPGTFARAVSAYVGLMHVEAPTPWSLESRNTAKAEVVLQTLVANDVLTEEDMAYLAARMTPDEAAAAGRPALLDEQAASVLAALLPIRLAPLVSRGIREVTGQKRVESAGLVDTVADLAMRATRGLEDTAAHHKQVKLMRSRYTRASRFEHYRTKDWTVTGRPVEDIHADAAAELATGSESWSARLELAALGQYHLTRHDVLTREKFGARAEFHDDMRGPDQLIAALLDSEWGLMILKHAVVDGRAGRRPRQVDDDGAPVDTEMTADWLKQDVVPRAVEPKPIIVVPDDARTPAMRLGQSRLQFASAVRHLAAAQDALTVPQADDGVALIDREGWPAEDARQLIEELRRVQDRLTVWAARSEEAARPLTSFDVGERLDDDGDDDEEFDERVD